MIKQRRFGLSSSGVLLRNFIVLSVSGLGAKALGLFVILLLARRLGADSFGRLNFAQTLTSYFIVFADFGISMYAVRTLAHERDRFVEHVGAFLGARLLMGLLSFSTLIAVAWLLPKSTEDKLLVALFSVNLVVSSFMIDWVYRSQEQMLLVAIGNATQTVLPLVLVAVFIQTEAQMFLVPLFIAVGIIGRALLYWQQFLRVYGRPELILRLPTLAHVLRQASPLGMSVLMIQIYYSIDTLLLGLMRSDAEVGWYNAAYRLVLVFTTLAGIIGDVIFPRLSRQSQTLDSQRKGQVMVSGAKFLIYVSLPIALVGALFSEQIIDFVYGYGYSNSAPALRIIIWQVFTVFTNVSFAYHLLAAGKNRYYLISVTSGAVVNLALNFLLIPHYGIIGASLATVVAEVTVLGMLYLFAVHLIAPAPMLAPTLRVAVAASALVVVGKSISDLWPALTLSLLAYVLVLLATVPFTREEIRLLFPWRIHESR